MSNTEPTLPPLYDAPSTQPQLPVASDSDITALENQLAQQTQRLNALEARLPNSWVISQNFFKRAFAIWGHAAVAGLIIGIIFYAIFFACTLMGLGSLGFLRLR